MIRTATDPMDQCAEIDEDMARLRCYDLVHRPRKAANDPVAIKYLSASSDVTSPGAESPPPSRHPMRIDLGYGFAFGNYAGSSATAGGTLEADAATGGQGGGMVVEAWRDQWPSRNLALGLEYLEINNRGALDATLPKGISILTDPVYAHLAVAVQAKVAIVNIAYRPMDRRRIHPVAGLGFGLGFATASVDNEISNAFIGTSRGLSKSSTPFPALQGFVGIDADITDRLYFSLIPRVLIVSAHPIGINQRYTDFILATNLGYRFP